ncbi:MAG: formate dehydrogenase accessory protein FdhE [Acidobacteriota bacterium]
MPEQKAAHRGRPDSREVVELTHLKEEHPELEAAADLQIELVQLQRRVQGRIPLPSLHVEAGDLQRYIAEGRPLLHFEQLPLNWSDFRFVLRETAATLQRHEAIEDEEVHRVDALVRDGNALEPVVQRWFSAISARTASGPPPTSADDETSGLDHVFTLAMRPFLVRCAEAVQSRLDLSGWSWGYCPVCGGEPEFGAITPAADRLLVCGRCTYRWKFDSMTCPYCGNSDRTRITSFASRDGMYRIAACDVCSRYLKSHDGRRASRPLLLPVDTVATLPLDAAAMQKGYKA